MPYVTAASIDRSVRVVERTLGVTLLAAVLTACVSTGAPPDNPHLDGKWQLDIAASDSTDAKISAAITGAEGKLRQRLANAGFSQYGNADGDTGAHGRRGRGGGSSGGPGSGGSAPDASGPGGTELNGDEYTATGYIGPDFAGLRHQLRLVLTAPKQLTINVLPDSVRISSDSYPERDYSFDDQFTRMDEYGTARIDSRWRGDTFELRARYSNHATLIERYTGDVHAHTLSVSFELTDPVAGKLSVHSLYR
jgi:hypothetical protein